MDKQEALDHLRTLCPPGATIYTVLRHVSKSGMHRRISLFVNGQDGLRCIDWAMIQTGQFRGRRDKEGLVANGCGMDMGFALVHELSHALYPKGFECIGKGCPSNDHSNGDRVYTPHHHANSGYTFRHQWI